MNDHHRLNQRDNQIFDDQDNENEISSANQFTDEEIREQLNCLGFKNIPHEKFKQFKDGMYSFLHLLILSEVVFMFFVKSRFGKVDLKRNVNEFICIYRESSSSKYSRSCR
jgi:hypothetical protein